MLFPLENNGCPNGFLLRTAFKTTQSFCDYFNKCLSYIKKCLTDAAVRILLNLPGIVEYYHVLGACCAEHSVHIVQVGDARMKQ